MKDKNTVPTGMDKAIGMLSDKDRLLQDEAFNRFAGFLAQMIMKYADRLEGSISSVNSSAERTGGATEIETKQD